MGTIWEYLKVTTREKEIWLFFTHPQLDPVLTQYPCNAKESHKRFVKIETGSREYKNWGGRDWFGHIADDGWELVAATSINTSTFWEEQMYFKRVKSE